MSIFSDRPAAANSPLSVLPHQPPTTIDARLANLGERRAKLLHELQRIAQETETLDEEFTRRGGWARGFLVVTNGVGHLHRSTNCQTCYPTTRFTWMTQVSGKTEQELVELAGERACTVCYPSAPVEVRNRPSQLFTPEEIEAKAKRDAQKVIREAKKAKQAEKAITAPDGSPLRVDGQTIKSLPTALSELTTQYIHRRTMSDDTYYAHLPAERRQQHVEGYAKNIDTLVAAIAHKTGWSQQLIRQEGLARATAKFKRDYQRAF